MAELCCAAVAWPCAGAARDDREAAERGRAAAFPHPTLPDPTGGRVAVEEAGCGGGWR